MRRPCGGGGGVEAEVAVEAEVEAERWTCLLFIGLTVQYSWCCTTVGVHGQMVRCTSMSLYEAA